MNRGNLFNAIERLELRAARLQRDPPPLPPRPTLAASPPAVPAAAKLPTKAMPPVVVPSPSPPPSSSSTAPMTSPAPPRSLRDDRGRLLLSAKSLKCTLVLNPAQIATITEIDRRQALKITTAAGRVVRSEIHGRGLRRAQALIAENGASQVSVILQGTLERDARGRASLSEAGLVSQVKKPAEAAK